MKIYTENPWKSHCDIVLWIAINITVIVVLKRIKIYTKSIWNMFMWNHRNYGHLFTHYNDVQITCMMNVLKTKQSSIPRETPNIYDCK